MRDGFRCSDEGERDEAPRRGGRARHRHRSLFEDADELVEPRPLSELSAEERADLKLRLARDLARYGGITLLCLIFFFPVGVIMAFVFGSKLLHRYYRAVLEPVLRERFVRNEVEKQVRTTLSGERQAMEGVHARSMEELSASIAHEIRNPITAAKSLVQQMGEDPGARDNVEYARVAMEELERVERSVSHLLRFARDEEMALAELELASVVESAVETFRDRALRAGIELTTTVDSPGLLLGDAEKLRRVVINLVGNALDAVSEGETSKPAIRVELGENLARTEVWLRVSDNGPGIPEEAIGRLWSPFFTSKDSGTGLGLAITRKLVEGHGGRIEVEAGSAGGAAFLVTLPKTPPSTRSEEVSA